jgi:hypothetical protein
MKLGVQSHAQAGLHAGMRNDTNFIGGCVGLGPVWTLAEYFTTHRDSISGPSSPQPVAIPTELSRPKCMKAIS